MQFLIDECLSPALVGVATARGYVAHHVAHRGWSGLKDHEILKRMLDEELILVTNNRDDFLALVQSVELHPGLVVIVDTGRRAQQVESFEIALTAAEGETSLINKVVEVSADDSVAVYDLPV